MPKEGIGLSQKILIVTWLQKIRSGGGFASWRKSLWLGRLFKLTNLCLSTWCKMHSTRRIRSSLLCGKELLMLSSDLCCTGLHQCKLAHCATTGRNPMQLIVQHNFCKAKPCSESTNKHRHFSSITRQESVPGLPAQKSLDQRQLQGNNSHPAIDSLSFADGLYAI